MTNTEIFLNRRNKIKQCLLDAGIHEDNILFTQELIPEGLPAGIIALEDEAGKNGTNRQYTSTELDFTIYLVVDAHDIIDPDLDVFTLKEAVRTSYKSLLNKDFPKVTYYPSRYKTTQKVRIAKIATVKGK